MLAIKAVWYSVIDAWLSVKRFFWMIAGSGISFETKPGALFIEVTHRNTCKTVRIGTDKLDAAIQYLGRQPHGAAVAIKEGDKWILVPNFLVPYLRGYLVEARDALARSRATPEVAGVGAVPAVNSNSKPADRRLN